MTWSKRMNLAIEYVESNLESPLRIEDVAKQAFCSRYHFHRLFFASFGMTCGEYIRRRKLTLAKDELLSSDSSVLDIAAKYGYESPNAFTRAFRHIYGINPGLARNGNNSLASFEKFYYPTKAKNGENMNYEIVEIPEFKILGRSKDFVFEDFVKQGTKFWKDYVGSDHYKQLYEMNNCRPGLITNAPLLSVYIPKEDGSRDEFTDTLGIEFEGKPKIKGFDQCTVPHSTYAQFDCTYKTSMKTNRYIYGQWLPGSHYERDGDKPDVVSYFPVPFRPMGEMRVRWWVPVKVST